MRIYLNLKNLLNSIAQALYYTDLLKFSKSWALFAKIKYHNKKPQTETQ